MNDIKKINNGDVYLVGVLAYMFHDFKEFKNYGLMATCELSEIDCNKIGIKKLLTKNEVINLGGIKIGIFNDYTKPFNYEPFDESEISNFIEMFN